MVRRVNIVQSPKADVPILVTVEGIFIVVRALHPSNALEGISINPSCRVTVLSLLLFTKRPPILFRLPSS